MSTKESIVKLDMDFNELMERVAQTNSNEVVQVSKENMNDKTLDEFVKRLEENIHKDKKAQ